MLLDCSWPERLTILAQDHKVARYGVRFCGIVITILLRVELVSYVSVSILCAIEGLCIRSIGSAHYMSIGRTEDPLVSIVTPVYNGETYLAECVESILSQTYQNWNYVIVNNCSTDRTREIADKYARQDARIRVHNNQRFVGMVENENVAFQQISPASQYSKMVHADDWLYPECLSKMVELAESNPSVGIIGAYGFNGTEVLWAQLEPSSTVVSGREICRRTLLGGFYAFGSPSSLLFRSDLLQGDQPFFDTAFFAQFSDQEACFRVLQAIDFGFVHQVLTFNREHEKSTTSAIADAALNGLLPGQLNILARYGPVYLTEAEYAKRIQQILDRYYQFLGRYPFKLTNARFRGLHLSALNNAKHPLSGCRLVRSSISQFSKALFNPKRAVRKVLQTITRCP